MNIEDLFLKFSLLGAQWVLWLLVGLSLISVAIMVERGVMLFRLRSDVSDVGKQLRRFFGRDDVAGALSYLNKKRGLEAAVAAVGLQEAHRGAAAVEETMESVRQQERVALERNVSFLGTVGANAPFYWVVRHGAGHHQGLQHPRGSTDGQLQIVMADISEALVATGVGLLVAIPAVVAFNVISRRIQRTLANSAAVEHLVLAHVKGERLDLATEEHGVDSGLAATAPAPVPQS